MNIKNKKGFTLIELLVVIAIIGLLATLATVALNTARAKSRDAKRVAAIKQVRLALDMYQNDNNGSYPTAANWSELDTALDSYLPNFPADPGTYSYTGSSSATTYTLNFGLEGTVSNLSCGTPASGCCSATPAGMTCT